MDLIICNSSLSSSVKGPPGRASRKAVIPGAHWEMESWHFFSSSFSERGMLARLGTSTRVTAYPHTSARLLTKSELKFSFESDCDSMNLPMDVLWIPFLPNSIKFIGGKDSEMAQKEKKK